MTPKQRDQIRRWLKVLLADGRYLLALHHQHGPTRFYEYLEKADIPSLPMVILMDLARDPEMIAAAKGNPIFKKPSDRISTSLNIVSCFYAADREEGGARTSRSVRASLRETTLP